LNSNLTNHRSITINDLLNNEAHNTYYTEEKIPFSELPIFNKHIHEGKSFTDHNLKIYSIFVFFNYSYLSLINIEILMILYILDQLQHQI